MPIINLQALNAMGGLYEELFISNFEMSNLSIIGISLSMIIPPDTIRAILKITER